MWVFYLSSTLLSGSVASMNHGCFPAFTNGCKGCGISTGAVLRKNLFAFCSVKLENPALLPRMPDLIKTENFNFEALMSQMSGMHLTQKRGSNMLYCGKNGNLTEFNKFDRI